MAPRMAKIRAVPRQARISMFAGAPLYFRPRHFSLVAFLDASAAQSIDMQPKKISTVAPSVGEWEVCDP
jgi:hypothetical protein